MSKRVMQATAAYFDAQRAQQDPRILEDPILYGLVGATANQRAAAESWQRAVDAAIVAGHPERLIAKAAGVTGPAIHLRKKKIASLPGGDS